jgi:tRNA modification GTPase
VEEVASIGGIPVRLIDTAGLRVPTDEVEAEGVRRAEAATKRADLVLLLLDRSVALEDADRELLQRDWGVPTIVIRNKSDLPTTWAGSDLPGTASDVIDVSARDGHGLLELREKILGLLVSGGVPSRNTVLLLDTWERDLLRRLAEALDRAVAAFESGVTVDIAAEELRAALHAAGELQGVDLSESILEQIFSRFCVGK